MLAFSQLKTLSIFHPGVEDSDVLRTLPQLHHLTELRIFRPEPEGPIASLDSVTALTGLSSFLFEMPLETEVAPETVTYIAAMTQLTFLGLKIGLGRVSLHCLTALVDLSIEDENWYVDALDIGDALSCMHHLTSLRLCDLGFSLTSVTPRLPKTLKRLIVAHMSVKPDFVKALMTIPDLTELRFRPGSHTFTDPVRFYAQLGLLKNLVVLEMPYDLIESSADLPTRTVQTCVRSLRTPLPNLRKLQLWFRLRGSYTQFDSFRTKMETSLINDRVLIHAFPKLRRVSITCLFIPWIGRGPCFFQRTCCADLFV